MQAATCNDITVWDVNDQYSRVQPRTQDNREEVDLFYLISLCIQHMRQSWGVLKARLAARVRIFLHAIFLHTIFEEPERYRASERLRIVASIHKICTGFVNLQSLVSQS